MKTINNKPQYNPKKTSVQNFKEGYKFGYEQSLYDVEKIINSCDTPDNNKLKVLLKKQIKKLRRKNENR